VSRQASPIGARLIPHPWRIASRVPPASHVLELLSRPTVLEATAAQTFKRGASSLREYCPHSTRQACSREGGPERARQCRKLHFRVLLQSHTDRSLGDCAYLSSCRKPHCKFVHYEIDEQVDELELLDPSSTREAPLAALLQAPSPPTTPVSRSQPPRRGTMYLSSPSSGMVLHATHDRLLPHSRSGSTPTCGPSTSRSWASST
jgi:hypothetical protein